MYIYVLFLIYLGILSSNNMNSGIIADDTAMRNYRNVRIARGGFIFLLLIFALRHPSMGNDLHYQDSFGYLGSFDRLNGLSWTEIFKLNHFMNYEKGYIVLNKVIGAIWNNRQFFIAVMAFLSLYPIYRFIKNKSYVPAMSYVVLLGLPVFLMYYSGFRQIIAIGICLYSVDYIQGKKIIKFLASVIIATLFHSSAWVFLIAYPLYYYRPSKKIRWISVGLIGVVYAFRYRLFNAFSVLFKEDVGLVESSALTLVIVFTAIYVFCFVFSDEQKNEEISGLMNIFYCACVTQSFAGLHNLAMRVGYYFMIILIVLLPNVINTMTIESNRKVMNYAVLSSFGVYGLYSLSTTFWAKAVPYYFFWQNI